MTRGTGTTGMTLTVVSHTFSGTCLAVQTHARGDECLCRVVRCDASPPTVGVVQCDAHEHEGWHSQKEPAQPAQPAQPTQNGRHVAVFGGVVCQPQFRTQGRGHEG